MVARSIGTGGSGSDRQCMADHMTKLFGDSVLILVLPFVWLWVFILLHPSATCGVLFMCKFQTLPTIILHFIVVSGFCQTSGSACAFECFAFANKGMDARWLRQSGDDSLCICCLPWKLERKMWARCLQMPATERQCRRGSADFRGKTLFHCVVEKWELVGFSW